MNNGTPGSLEIRPLTFLLSLQGGERGRKCQESQAATVKPEIIAE
jgi:hypothetical protein